MALRRITAPATKPVTNDEVAMHMRAELLDDYALVSAYIGAITEKAENVLRRALITQTWELVLDAFPSTEILLPLSPIQSVTSIKYLNSDGIFTTMSASDYVVDTASEPGRIVPAYGKSFPVALDLAGSVIIRYVCGYGTADAVPDSIKAWIMMNVATLYENRESVSEIKVSETGVCDSLLMPYRIITW